MKDETTTAMAPIAAPRGAIKTHDIMSLMLTEMGPLQFCSYLADSGLYAKGQNAMAQIVAIIATGAEVGMGPMWSLKNIQFVGDKHSFTAGGTGDLVMRSGYMMYHVVEKTPKRCELRWTRDGKDVGHSYFDLDKARTAGLTSNTWKKYPESMLFARALTDGGRTYCPEVFGGSPYTPEELGRSEVVHVSQPDRPVQVDRDKERTAARNNLVEVIGRCTTNRDERVRVYKTVLKKCDKGDKQMTTAEYREYAGMVKAFHEDDNLTQWCDTFGPAAVQDAEVVDAEVVEPNADDWKRANGMFHAELTTFLKAGNHETKGDEYKIIKDVVRDMCGLEFDAEWSEVTPAEMRKVAKTIAHDGGALARVGIVGDWQTIARSRGAIE